jgi:PAS domain S-box-containing protein
MNDRYKTKDKLIRDLQQLRQENKSFKALLDSGQRESASPEVSAIEAIVAMVIQGKSDKLAWWQADISTGKLHCDQHKMERWGCPPEKFNSLTDFASLIHPEDFDPVKRAVDEFVTGTVDQLELEYRVRAHSGEYLWLSMSGSVVNYDGDGKPLICAGFVYNITEHKQVQEGLFKKEQMLQALMDNFPGVIFWKDRDSRYLGCNQALATRAGLDNPGQIVGKTDDQLPWGPKEAEKFRAEDLKVFESGQALLHMDEPQPHQGQEAWFDKSKFPIRDTHGQVIALLGIGHDVSRLKVTEQELIDANQQLTLQNKQKAKQAAALKKPL